MSHLEALEKTFYVGASEGFLDLTSLGSVQGAKACSASVQFIGGQ